MSIRAFVAALHFALVAAGPLMAAGATAADTAPPASADPAARAVVEQMVTAMGGAEAFAGIGGMRFTITFSSKDTVRSSRTHWWDRRTGDYRIQGKTRKGEAFVYLFNVNTKEGRAWLDGREVEGEVKKGQLERAYALFINDTYWLLMPAKLFDPGVHLASDGEAVVNGATVDRVKVTFDKVGLTPGDTYWAYIDRKSHLMTRWGMILQGDRDKPDARETFYDWTDWSRFGPVVLSPSRLKADDPDRTGITFRDLEVVDAFDSQVFTNPETILLPGR